MNKIFLKTNSVVIIASILNILGLILVLLSAFKLTPLTMIFSLSLGGPLIFISLIIYIIIVIVDDKRRRISG